MWQKRYSVVKEGWVLSDPCDLWDLWSRSRNESVGSLRLVEEADDGELAASIGVTRPIRVRLRF